jgi:hypothetical protein
MKKILTIFTLVLLLNTSVDAQCPPGAFAYQSLYPQCPSGCGVLLLGWPEGVLVNIYGGSPLIVVSNAIISGTLGGGGTGDAFTCVPCNIPLVYASAIPGANGGCVIATIGIVPVKLTNFMVNISGTNSCEIKWSSSQETEPVKYIIQRSNNGRDFTDIVTINGLHQALNKYAYTDLNVSNNTQFYRVKVVELSGHIFYSETSLVKTKAGNNLTVYPNPVIEGFKVTIPTQNLPANVQIMNAQGQIIYTQAINTGTTEINKQLATGIYSVRVVSKNKGAFTQTIIKK